MTPDRFREPSYPWTKDNNREIYLFTARSRPHATRIERNWPAMRGTGREREEAAWKRALERDKK